MPESARATWTDERLDDLVRRMEQGFVRVDEDIRALGARIDRQGEELGARIERQGVELGARIDRQGAGLNARFDALQRTMLAMMVTILIGFAGLIATQI